MILICVTLVFDACISNAREYTNVTKNDNYVVLLDLSDRIIQKPDQVDIDTNAITAVFKKFENSVQRNMVVKSGDKFAIRIIPQKNSNLSENMFENVLSIDMSKYNAAEKMRHLNEFKSKFSNQLRILYQQAILGNRNTDFAGVDIWQYFNEQINNDLNAECNNKVLVLTDGYFDFEDKNHGIYLATNATVTAPLLKKMNSLQWRKQSDENNTGLIPVKLDVEAKWLICGIQPKTTSKDLLEAEKLVYLWKKWLVQSGAKNVSEPIINSSSSKIGNLIYKNL